MEHEDRRHLYARARRGRLFASATSTTSCARICMSIMSAGTRGSKTAAGCRPFRRRATCSARPSSTTGPSSNAKTPVPPFADSVLPIVEARQAEIVRDDHQIGDHARILPTPGHTPGHVAFTFGRGKDDAVFSRRPDAFAAADALSGIVGEVRRRPGAGRQRRGAVSWSAIATPIRCAAPRISPRRPRGRSAAPATDFPARRYERDLATPTSKPFRWKVPTSM